MQIQLYRYSLDVVATSHELYSSFGMRIIIGWLRVKKAWSGKGRKESERKHLVSLRGPQGIFCQYFFFILFFFFPPVFHPSFILSFLGPVRPVGLHARTTTNEHIKALSSYYSLRPSIFPKADDERKDKLLGKSSRCSRDMPAGEPEEWPSRDGHWKLPCATTENGSFAWTDEKRSGENVM